jgi:hypothetical protein
MRGIGPQGLGVSKNNGYTIGEGSGRGCGCRGICQCGKSPIKKLKDLSGDGKVTRKDVLMGRGVIESPLKKTAAWTRKEGKDPKGGLNAKGVASYRRENPGSKLQTAVTKKPSELKPGSKDAKRRKSFCARMSGMPGPLKKPNGEPTRKKLALDKWNC